MNTISISSMILQLFATTCLISRHFTAPINPEHVTRLIRSTRAVASVTGTILDNEINQEIKDIKIIPNGLLIEYPLSGIALKSFRKMTKVEIPINSIKISQMMPYNILELYRMY